MTKREKPDETALIVNDQQSFLFAAMDKSLGHFPQSLIEPLLLLTSLIDVTVYTDSRFIRSEHFSVVKLKIVL